MQVTKTFAELTGMLWSRSLSAPGLLVEVSSDFSEPLEILASLSQDKWL